VMSDTALGNLSLSWVGLYYAALPPFKSTSSLDTNLRGPALDTNLRGLFLDYKPPIKNFGGRPSITNFEGRPSIQDFGEQAPTLLIGERCSHGNSSLSST